MKLVFIYGQAGVGKLTVGRELADLTGMALFHNHLVVDAVGSVFHLNRFVWPGPDLRVIAKRALRSAFYRCIPQILLDECHGRMMSELARAVSGCTVGRTEDWRC